ncbi:MAG TPA: hypothetical protein VJH23_05280 [archaeon]|nr:hypothetical protein [archaeon]
MSAFPYGTVQTKKTIPAANHSAKASVRSFSIGFSLLSIFPYLLAIVFALAAGVKFGFFGINKALALLLVSLITIYFALPMMAQRLESGIWATRKARKN